MKKHILLLPLLIFLAACQHKNAEEKVLEQPNINNVVTLTGAQYKNAGVQTDLLQKRNLSTVLKLNGKIDVPPQNSISVSTAFGGFLKSTKLLPGMPVKKGEVIATIEDERYIQLQQDYLTTKAKLKFSENEYHRQKELNQSKASSDKLFQETEMDFTTQKIALNALAEKLRLINVQPETLTESNLSRSINIYSSIDGFVSKVNVNIGKYVNPSDILFELINPEDIHLNLKVFEKDVTKLSIGQKLMAYNNNDPDKKYHCEIILISQDLSADRSAEVHCHFDDYDKTLSPGMYMNAEVEIALKNSLSIHEEAIVNFEGKDFVFISTDTTRFEMVEIEKGITENSFTEIHFLVARNFSQTKFVTKGAYSLLMQLKNTSE